ncbi:MAG: 3-isopropylmalate dehydratase small subunit [Candidatus Brockarchaeota archaeon]|nr:3-isopropylmalate dehydratase small subunit [Candidatus Brockarchaeota archaeon]
MGKAYKVGDNVDTDLIIPARYLNLTDPAQLAAHCFEDLDPQFPKLARERAVLVAGRNFGCGSSREHAPVALKAAGVECVVAKTFARIFYRNAVNVGLPVLECEEAADKTRHGDELEFDLRAGTVTNVSRNETYAARPLPEFMLEIYASGGLMKCVSKRLGIGRG